ncbi:MAG: permease-like cell division protein FtsX [Patescibacteria group bacterium]
MIFTSSYRALKLGWQNFWRNRWLSLVTVLILILTLFLISLIVTVKVVADKTLDSVKDKVDMSVYFSSTADKTVVTELQARLEEMPEVTQVTYISPDEALTKFKEDNKDNPVVLEAIEALDTNPLGAALVIKSKELSDYPAIIDVLDDPVYQNIIQDKARDFENNQSIIDKLSNITNNINKFGLVLAAVFAVIAILMIFNTIRINIYSYREEIGIMKLVGASNGFVRAPFVIESIIYALIASLICLGLIFTLINTIAPFLNRFFAGYELNIVDYFNQNFLLIFASLVVLSIIMCVLSSLIAVRRYLRV